MYQLRGVRVLPLSPQEIFKVAMNVCNILNVIGFKSKRFDKVLEKLHEYRITIDIKSDKEWEKLTYNLTGGHFDPATMTIRVPNSTYVNACKKGCAESLHVILHELGHLFLRHRAILHHSDVPVTKYEDSEVQADIFADSMCLIMGIDMNEQLELFK